MDNLETLKQVADATLQEPVQFEVDVYPQNNYQKLLQKWGRLPEKRVFVIRPIVYGNMIRISRLFLEIDMEVLDEKNLLEGNYRLMDQYGEKLAEVIAVAVQNTKAKPSRALTNFFVEQCSSWELYRICLIVRKMMGVQNFMNTIISMRGLTVLEKKEGKNGKPEVSLTNQGS